MPPRHPTPMSNLRITVERRVIVSSRKFEDVIASIHAAIGHPDMHDILERDCRRLPPMPKWNGIIHGAVGPSGLMEFMRFDHGQFLQKTQNTAAPVATPRIVRIVIGNPLIMMAMATHVHDAGSYAPVTLLVDEREDGVHLSYDTMASYLARLRTAGMRCASRPNSTQGRSPHDRCRRIARPPDKPVTFSLSEPMHRPAAGLTRHRIGRASSCACPSAHSATNAAACRTHSPGDHPATAESLENG